MPGQRFIAQMAFEQDAASKMTGLRLSINGEGEGELSIRIANLP